MAFVLSKSSFSCIFKFKGPSMMPLIERVKDQSFHPDIFTMAKHFWNLLNFYLTAACVLPVQANNSMAFTETGAFRHHPSIRIELIAAEPDVVDPVALCFDASGNMYVVEMRDYPYGKGPTGSPGGTIRKLTTVFECPSIRGTISGIHCNPLCPRAAFCRSDSGELCGRE